MKKLIIINNHAYIQKGIKISDEEMMLLNTLPITTVTEEVFMLLHLCDTHFNEKSSEQKDFITLLHHITALNNNFPIKEISITVIINTLFGSEIKHIGIINNDITILTKWIAKLDKSIRQKVLTCENIKYNLQKQKLLFTIET